jgi:hypothetical protein
VPSGCDPKLDYGNSSHLVIWVFERLRTLPSKSGYSCPIAILECRLNLNIHVLGQGGSVSPRGCHVVDAFWFVKRRLWEALGVGGGGASSEKVRTDIITLVGLAGARATSPHRSGLKGNRHFGTWYIFVYLSVQIPSGFPQLLHAGFSGAENFITP